MAFSRRSASSSDPSLNPPWNGSAMESAHSWKVSASLPRRRDLRNLIANFFKMFAFITFIIESLKYELLTNVTVLQVDQNKNHTHNMWHMHNIDHTHTVTHSCSDDEQSYHSCYVTAWPEWSESFTTSGSSKPWSDGPANSAGTGINDTGNGTNSGTECRPSNCTIKIWKRIS